MRLPLIPNLSTKDGEANKNARMTNALSEKNPTGAVFCTVRPGLEVIVESVGNGRGIVEFNDKLLSVYGSELQIPVIPDRIGYGEQNESTLVGGGLEKHVLPAASSYDGMLVTGFVEPGDGTTSAFVWNGNLETLQLLDRLGTGTEGYGTHVNAAGTKVLGYSKTGVGSTRVPFTWTEADGVLEVTGFTGVSTVNGATSTLDAFCGRDGNGAYIWKDGVGKTTFSVGTTTNPLFISDTYVIVGTYVSAGQTHLFKRDADGTTTTFGQGVPTCITADGNAFFGYSGALGSGMRPARWTAATGWANLSSTAGMISGCSSDGTVAVGAIDMGASLLYPFRWTADGGIVTIDLDAEYGFTALIENGDYNPKALKISKDGKTIVGLMYITAVPTSNFSIFVYQIDYGFDTVLRINKSIQNSSYQYVVPSGDGWSVFYTINAGEDPETFEILEYMYRWTRDTGQFRDLATLEDQFFDFVQSTL